MSDDGDISIINSNEIARAFERKDMVYYAATSSRLGFKALSGLVEYTYFHPMMGPDSNADFTFYLIKFGVLYYMFSVPMKFRARVHKMVDAVKLRPVRGIPVMIGTDGEIHRFPGADQGVKNRNLFFIESIDTTIYNNDPDLNEIIRQREKHIIDAMLTHGSKINPQAVGEYLWRRQ